MKIYDWEPFLRKWSAERYAVSHAGSPAGPAEEWLGFGPAHEERIATLELRLGIPLPPSYRQFLAVSDGWRWAGEFVPLLGGTDRCGPLRELEPGVYASLLEWDAEDEEEWAEEDEEECDGEDGQNDAEDEEGDGGEAEPWERPYPAGRWDRALLISVEGDQTWLMLDPGDVSAHGEWAAYRMSSWSGAGPVRYASFAELMDALHHEFRELRAG